MLRPCLGISLPPLLLLLLLPLPTHCSANQPPAYSAMPPFPATTLQAGGGVHGTFPCLRGGRRGGEPVGRPPAAHRAHQGGRQGGLHGAGLRHRQGQEESAQVHEGEHCEESVGGWTGCMVAGCVGAARWAGRGEVGGARWAGVESKSVEMGAMLKSVGVLPLCAWLTGPRCFFA